MEGAGHLKLPRVLPCGPASRKVPSHGAPIAFPPRLPVPPRLFPRAESARQSPGGSLGAGAGRRLWPCRGGNHAGGGRGHSSGG